MASQAFRSLINFRGLFNVPNASFLPWNLCRSFSSPQCSRFNSMLKEPGDSNSKLVQGETKEHPILSNALKETSYGNQAGALQQDQNDTSSGQLQETGNSSENYMGTYNEDILSRQLLLSELSKIYSKYENNEDLDAALKEELDSSIPEESREVIGKAKELFVNALKQERSPGVSQGSSSSRKSDGLLQRKASDFAGIRTVYGDLMRPFSTSSARRKGDGDCLKAKKLPCLQATELSGKKAETSAKGVCERFCMPCCKPARDPPICFYPFVKPPCSRMKPPRPAFSECKLLFPLKNPVPCECVRPPIGTCKQSAESSKCTK